MKMLSKLPSTYAISLAFGLLVTTSTGLSSTVLFSDNFNSYTSITDTAFTNNYALSGALVATSSGTGLGGSTSLSIPTSQDHFLNYKTGLTLTEGSSLTFSVYFLRVANTGATNFAQPEIGFADTSGASVDTGVAMRLNGGSTLTWQFRSLATTAGTGEAIALGYGWFQMNVTLSLGASNMLTVSGTLYNSDSNGTVGSLASSYSPAAIANPYSDSTIFAGIRVENNRLSNMDNFSITSSIPEPSTAGLLAGGLAFMCVAYRRKRG